MLLNAYLYKCCVAALYAAYVWHKRATTIISTRKVVQQNDKISHYGSTVAKWLAMPPHSKKVLGYIWLGQGLCGVSMFSPRSHGFSPGAPVFPTSQYLWPRHWLRIWTCAALWLPGWVKFTVHICLVRFSDETTLSEEVRFWLSESFSTKLKHFTTKTHSDRRNLRTECSEWEKKESKPNLSVKCLKDWETGNALCKKLKHLISLEFGD